MEYSDHIFHLNFAITLFNHGDLEEARKQFRLFSGLFAENGGEGDEGGEGAGGGQDADVVEMKGVLGSLLGV